jgi:hypothetical protein
LSTLHSIAAIARADFLERVRRYSFLLTLIFALFLGYSAATGRISLQLGEYRGVYTSAWIGALVAMTTNCFVTLVGFYVVKNAVDRDRTTGVGQILAATPLAKSSYTLGKFLSNFAVLSAAVVVLAVCAVLMQIFAGEDPHLDIAALLAPFLVVALPSMALTAAIAVLFETLPLLRGGLGNVAWFFAWSMLGIGLPEISGNHKLDPMGLMVMADSMMAGAREHIPGYKDSFSFTVADTPVKVVSSFRWQGVHWTAEDLLLRVVWTGAAVTLVLLAALVFDRFDSARAFAPSLRRKNSQTAQSGFAAARSGQALHAQGVTRTHLTPLGGSVRTNSFVRIFGAELRLLLKGLRWWWYAVAIGLLVAQLATPFSIARGPVLGVSLIWPVLVWSGLGARETRFATGSLLFSSAGILKRQLPACWLAGVVVALLAASGTIIRLIIAHDAGHLLTVITGSLFVPTLALCLGVVSGTSKFFEGLYTLIWYIGPMNHTPSIDYTGGADQTHPFAFAAKYLALIAVLMICAFQFRARQLRGN